MYSREVDYDFTSAINKIFEKVCYMDNIKSVKVKVEIEEYKDKNGVILKEGDFVNMNPEDDNWLDIIVSHHGRLVLASELRGGDIKLKEVILGNDNPCIKVGNIHENRIEFHEF